MTDQVIEFTGKSTGKDWSYHEKKKSRGRNPVGMNTVGMMQICDDSYIFLKQLQRLSMKQDQFSPAHACQGLYRAGR